MSRFKVGDKVIVKPGLVDKTFNGTIVNINDFRPPEGKYAVEIYGLSDLVFLGDNDLEEVE